MSRPIILLAPKTVSENIRSVFSSISFCFDAVFDLSEISEISENYPTAIVMSPAGANRCGQSDQSDQQDLFPDHPGITFIFIAGDDDKIALNGSDPFSWVSYPPSPKELAMLIRQHQLPGLETTGKAGPGPTSFPDKENQSNYREKYKLIFEQLPMIAIQGYNLDREVIFWNKASETLYGYDIQEAVGRKLEDLIIPEELKQRVLDDIENFLRYNKPIQPDEYLLQRKDGKKVPVFTSNVIVTNNSGEKELFSIDLDLSQIKRHQLIQEVLNEIAASVSTSGDLQDFLGSVRFHLSKIVNTRNFFIAFYNEADNSFTLPIFVDDKDRFRSFPAGRTLTGYMLGMNKPLLLNEEQINELDERNEIDRIGSMCKQWMGIPLKTEGRNTGAIVLQSYSDDILYDETDMRTMQIVAEQISIAIGRKSAQEALRESERALKTLISNLPGIAYRCKFDSAWTMEFLSDGFKALTGYSVHDCVGNRKISFSELIHPDDRDIIHMKIKDAVNHDESYQLIYRLVTSGGSIRWVWEKGRGIPDDQKNIAALEGFIIDITDRIEMENQILAAKEKAEESDRLKSAFLANLSHEIRSPMNSIMGFSQLLKLGNTPESISEYSDIIYRSSNQLLSVITNIVDQARIDSGQVRPARKPFSPADLIGRVEKQTMEQLLTYPQKKVDVNLCPEPGYDDILLESDEDLVFLVMSHLVNNAVKFTDTGHIEVGYGITGNTTIRFFVRDTGIGISGRHHDIIFERFRQAEETVARNFGGAGLGLSISRGIARLLNGDLNVSSAEGKGSEFNFTMPLK
jgi:PAS domain S-box-containing protein